VTIRSANIEAIYPLTPVQEGILFHTLFAPDSQLYFQQYVCSIEGDLDPGAFRESWQWVIDRHPPLRSLIAWEGREQPLQIVRSRVQADWREDDWRSLEAEVQSRRIAKFLQEDRARGLQLDVAPLLRFALFRTGDALFRFVWSHHHIVVDGWSLGIVLSEVFHRYATIVSGDQAEPPPPPVFRDYVAWLRGRDLAPAEEFWRGALKGFDQATALPIESGLRSARWAERHGEETLRLSASATAEIDGFARAQGVTLNTLLRGAWALVLARYSSSDDVVFGATLSGRPPELAGSLDTVGLFINTLPVRVNVAPGSTVGKWLDQIQRWQVKAGPYELTPLPAIQDWSDLPGGQQLFETILAFENVPNPPTGVAGLGVSAVRYLQRSNYPIAVLVMPGEELEFVLLYDADRFDPRMIHRMAGQLGHVVQALAADADRDVAAVPFFPDDELDEIIEGWNRTDADYPADRTIHELIGTVALAHPDRDAVIGSGISVSYGALDRRAELIAERLRAIGVRPGGRVAVSIARSPATVVAILGVLKAGGAYVPLDPDLPAARNSFLLKDTAARAVIVEEGVEAPKVDSARAAVAVVELDRAGNISSAPVEGTAAGDGEYAGPDDPAYVIYTSGSAGLPKGVVVTHRNLVNSTYARVHAYDGDVKRFLLLSPFIFDSSVAGLFSSLTQGGTLVLPEPRMEQDVDHLADLVATHGVTHTLALPTVYGLMLELADTTKLQSLELIMVAGEACPPTLVAEHYEKLPATRLVNEYGPTEATVWCTVQHLGPPGLSADGGDTAMRVPIGRPIANTQAFILDRDGRPVPVGVPGELHVGGLGLARGYLDSPELTADRFIDVSLPKRGRTRLYRTGDVARFLADGTIDLLGRTDFQVKIRGQRIELEEIEMVLKEHPAVRDAAAVLEFREGTPGSSALGAYVQTSAQPDELRRFMVDRLPDAMVPVAIVALDTLPRGPTGKLDRRALPRVTTQDTAVKAYVAPVGDVEESLAAIWAEVLGREAVGATDNFFELGGDSILSIRIIARAHREGLVISPKQFFEHPTVSGLAAVVERRNE